MNQELNAINKMLWETCGEDRDLLENASVTEISPNTYHISYKPDDPYDGVDFKVSIAIENNICHYSVFDSVYGDDGEFTIEL